MSAICPICNNQYKVQETTISSQMRELIVDKLSCNPDLFEKMWKARNSIVAHGNQPVNAGVLINLTQLKLEAISLVYKSIKLKMGIPLEEKPNPHRTLFITDALMYAD
jgi:hypothetical protein